MRHGGVGSGDDLRLEGQIIRTVQVHPVDQLRLQFLFRHADAEHLQRFRQRFFRQALGVAQSVPVLRRQVGAQRQSSRSGCFIA